MSTNKNQMIKDIDVRMNELAEESRQIDDLLDVSSVSNEEKEELSNRQKRIQRDMTALSNQKEVIERG